MNTETIAKPEPKPVTPDNEQAIALAAKDPAHLMALAVSKGADPTVLSKLMDLAERWNALKAREAYVLAMTRFKAKVPPVLAKDAVVDFASARGRTHYRYANLGSIVQVVTPLLSKEELSASWETGQDDKGNIRVTCHITHAAGHRESVMLAGPPDNSGNKNPIQMIGSTTEYLRRYTFLCATGLATGDVDTDGRPAEPTPAKPEPQGVSEAQIKRLYAIAKSKGVDTKTLADRIVAEHDYLVGPKGEVHLRDLRPEDYDAVAAWIAKGCPEQAPQDPAVEDTIPMDFPGDAKPAPAPPPEPVPPKTKLESIWPEEEFDDATEVIPATVVNIIDRVKSPKTGSFGPWQIVIKRDDDTQYTASTFVESLRNVAEAAGATGEPVELAIQTTEKGEFRNRKLIGVKLP